MGVPEGPNPFPCGGPGQQACPPQPALDSAVRAIIAAGNDPVAVEIILRNAILEHGQNVYQAAKKEVA